MTSSTQLYDYLMDSVEFLKNEDLTGWKRKFEESPVAPPPPRVKRLKQSPCCAPPISLQTPLCMECNNDTLLDGSQIVCTTCGLIQLQGVFSVHIAHCTYRDRQSMTRVYIHYYDRVANFMTVIRFRNGDSDPEIPAEAMSDLQAALSGLPITITNVTAKMKDLGLNRKYTRHKYSITRILGGGKEKYITGDVVFKLVKIFKILNYMFFKYKKVIWKKKNLMDTKD